MADFSENSKTSGNAYSGRKLKRMKIEYSGTSIKFAVNPEDYTQSEPNRATITQTKGGAWIDAWGGGIRELTIKGTTGVKGTGKSIDTGYQRWKELRNLFRKVYDAVQDGQEVKDLIRFYNYTDNEFFYCYPTQAGIELYRSKSRPHIYQYTIHLWVIRKLGEPASKSGSVGNPNKSSGSGGNSKTTKSQTVSVQSGGYATFKTRNTDSQVDMSTITNTKTKTIVGIQEDCHEYYLALEPLIGGKAGKISPVTGFQCTQGITMQSAGTVSNVNSFTGDDLLPPGDYVPPTLMLFETKYVSRVSAETYTMYSAIKEYSPEILSPAYSLVVGISPKQRVMQAVNNSVVYDSTILELLIKYQAASTLSKSDVNHVKILLLESMMVYRELYRLYEEQSEEDLSTTITLTNLEMLISNIRAMIMYFTLKSTEYNKYDRMDISAELRKLEKIMTQVKTDIVDYL